MKVPDYIKDNLNQQAEFYRRNKEYDRKFRQWCKKERIKTNTEEFIGNYFNLKKNADASELIKFLETAEHQMNIFEFIEE